MPVSELGSAWNLSPAVLVPAVLALALYAQGFVRLRRRGRRDHAPWWRAAAFVLGVVLVVLALVSPLDAIGEEYLLSALLQHVLIGDAAAALVLLGLTGPAALLPALGALRPLARFGPLRAIVSVLRPAVASRALWAAVLAAWHVPAAFDAALETRWVHDLEHPSFVLAGFLMWYQLLDPARRGHLARSARLALAVIMFAAGQALASVLVFSGRALRALRAAGRAAARALAARGPAARGRRHDGGAGLDAGNVRGVPAPRRGSGDASGADAAARPRP